MSSYTQTPFINKVVYAPVEVLVAGFSALNDYKARKHRAEMAERAKHLQAQIDEHQVYEKDYPGEIKIRVSEFVISGLKNGLLKHVDDRFAWVEDGDIEKAMDDFYHCFYAPLRADPEPPELTPMATPCYFLYVKSAPDGHRVLTDKSGDPFWFRSGDVARTFAHAYTWKFGRRAEPVFTYAHFDVSFVEDRI